MIKLTLSRFKAILYGDVFDYPLTYEEIKKFEIPARKAGRRNSKFETNPKSKLSNSIQEKEGYFFLQKREKLVEIRKKREKHSREKLKIAKRVGKWLKIIPFIKMIAVTGAVSAGNGKKDDDIDLMIVSAKNRVWTTRFLAILLLELLGKRRRPKDKNFKNKICLNMFLDEDNLAVPKKESDLFSAHEAAQIKILWSKDKTDKRFWEENRWVNNYLPNFKFSCEAGSRSARQISNFKNEEKYLNIWILKLICHFGEEVLKQIQLLYMKNKRTKEVIADGYLRFHPQDAREWVMREYGKRLREYGL